MGNASKLIYPKYFQNILQLNKVKLNTLFIEFFILIYVKTFFKIEKIK